MTDKKRMAGICDFLIQLPDKSIVLGDLKTVSSLKSLKTRKPATAQLGAVCTSGPAHHELDAIRPTDPAAVLETYAVHRQVFADNGLEAAFGEAKNG